MATSRKPRKTPVQCRSRQTVDTIVEAGARILAEDGYSRMTTNRVAERAGVSIGSLYQYFSGKASLLRAIHERHQRHVAEQVGEDFSHAEDLTTYAGTRALIAAVQKAHRIDPKIHGVLENLRREGELAADMHDGLLGWLAEKLEVALRRTHAEHLPSLRVPAQVMVATVHAVIEAHERGEIACSDDELVDQISSMVFGYKAFLRQRGGD